MRIVPRQNPRKNEQRYFLSFSEWNWKVETKLVTVAWIVQVKKIVKSSEMERLPLEICMKIFYLLDYQHLAVAQQGQPRTLSSFLRCFLFENI